MKTLKELYEKVVEQFNETKTLSSCRELISQYEGLDWKKYVEFSDVTYKRNILSEFSNSDIEFILICWNACQASPVHDHPSNGCLVRILEGQLTEDFYVMNHKCTDTSYKFVGFRDNKVGDVSYMEKNHTVHRIKNTNNDKQSISLHIYSPPKFGYTMCKVDDKGDEKPDNKPDNGFGAEM